MNSICDHPDSMQTSSLNDKKTDDWITLYGDNQTSYWQIPINLKRCPVSSCGRKFEDVQLLSAHFNKHHAKKSTYCGVCNVPIICSKYPEDLASHYQRIHPDVPFPCDQTKIKKELQEIEV